MSRAAHSFRNAMFLNFRTVSANACSNPQERGLCMLRPNNLLAATWLRRRMIRYDQHLVRANILHGGLFSPKSRTYPVFGADQQWVVFRPEAKPHRVSLSVYWDHLKKWVSVCLLDLHQDSFVCIHICVKGPNQCVKSSLVRLQWTE